MRDWLGFALACAVAAGGARADVSGPRRWAVEDQGLVYLTSGSALYRVDSDARAITEVPLPPRIAGQDLREIGLFDGFLWIATDSLVANADARYLDWVIYDAADGCPLPDYAGMTSLGGEVWVAGRRTLGRFEQIAERWTTYAIPSDSVRDVAVFTDYVWLADSEALIRFDVAFEKTRVFRCGADVPLPRVSWMERVGEELWAFGPGGAVRYLPATESWQLLTCPDIAPSQVLTQGALAWMIGAGGIVAYDAASRSCRQPPWMHRVVGSPHDGAVHRGKVYFATDSLLVAYEPSGDPAELKGDLAFPGSVDGLTRLPFSRITSTGTRLLAMGDEFVAVLCDDEGQWWVANVSPRPSSSRGVSRIRIGDGLELALWSPPLTTSGSYTYLMQAHGDGAAWSVTDRHRVRLLSRSGPVSAFVDNTDQLLGDRYGIAFNGGPSAKVREVGAGWRRADAELMDLAGRLGYRGGYARVEHGSRSAQRGRRPVEARAWVGERTTKHAEEYRSGGASSYTLSHGNVVIGSARIYLDGRQLDEGSFTLDHSSGSFFLSFLERDLVTEDSIVRIAYDYWLPEDADRPFTACPQLVVNQGDSWSLSLGSLIQRSDNRTHPLVSGGARYRSAPDRARRASVEAEVLGDPDEGEIGSRAMTSYAADRIDLQAGILSLPAGIATEGRIETEYGPLERELAFSGRLEPSRSLPLSWRSAWRSAGRFDGFEGEGRLTWGRPGLPALSLDLGIRDWDADTLSASWRKVELGGDYDPGVVPGLGKLRAQVLARQSTDDSGHESTRYRSALARMHMRPAGVLDLATVVWGRRADDVSGGATGRLSSSGSGLLTATAAPVEGLSVYLRGEARIATEHADSSAHPHTKDARLDRSLLLSAVMRPRASPVELEGSFSRSLSDLLDDVGGGSTLADLLAEVGGARDVRQARSQIIGGGPVVFLPAQSTLRLRASQASRTRLDSLSAWASTTQRTYLVRLDVRPMSESRWYLEGSGSTSRDNATVSESWNAYARWERRWNRLALSRIAFNATLGKASTDTWSWAPSAYVQVGPGDRGVEVRGEIGAGRRRSAATESFINGGFRLEVRFLNAFLARVEVRPEVVFPRSGSARSSTVVSLRAGATL